MQYITRSSEGVLISTKGKHKIIGSGLISYIDAMCIDNLSTYDGRKQAAKKLLNEKSNLPIYVNEKVFLYPTKSLRDFSVFFINYFEVLSIKKISNLEVEINYDDLSKIIVQANYSKLSRQHDRINLILEQIGGI